MYVEITGERVMYLSKVSVAQTATMPQIFADLFNNGAYAAHQLLWKLFDHYPQREFLYRQEQDAVGLPIFWVLSQQPPRVNIPQLQVETKHFSPNLSVGQKLAFKLRANPTICDSKTQKRHDVMMYAKHLAKANNVEPLVMKQQMELAAKQWLANPKRLEQWGITIEFLPDIEAYIQHRCRKRSGTKIQFSSVDYQGVLTVNDPEKFLQQYIKGFGRSKALGCGLMLIRGI